MKLGSVLGPFPGRFWLDLATHVLTVSPGVEGTAAEVQFQLTPDAAAGMVEGLLLEALPEPTTHIGYAHYPRPIEPRPIEVPRAKRKRYEPPPPPRPETVSCSCGSVVRVRAKGRVPTRCPSCVRRHTGSETLGASITAVVAKRGA
jgi:hypothetical protein